MKHLYHTDPTPFKMAPGLFMDLDGTIREPIEGKFVNTKSNQRLIPGVLARMKEWKSRGYFISVVTNQGGIAHGFKTIQSWTEEIMFLDTLIPHGLVDTFNYCPFHEEGRIFPFNTFSHARKPGIGMIHEAAIWLFNQRHIVVDWSNSVMVGDMDTDEQCAKNAGLTFIHINDFLNEEVGSPEQ